MEVDLQPGQYVIAISGGVDSMSLLHLLAADKRYQLVVAHFDHGIRPDSAQDAALVKQQAERYGLAFALAEGKLGAKASEATARRARYAFLRNVLRQTGATAIVTAHHQDDLLETILLNLLRGTNRKGLSPMRSQPDILRPLLRVPKATILAYAQQNNIAWREDSTNNLPIYKRNYVRQQLMPQLSARQRQQLVNMSEKMADLNSEADKLIPVAFSRQEFMAWPHAVSREVMAAWLRHNNITDFDRKTLERLVVAAKTLLPGQQVPVLNGRAMLVEKHKLALKHVER